MNIRAAAREVTTVEQLTMPVQALPAFGWISHEPVDLNRIEAVENIHSVKPLGGLWLSPLNEDYTGTVWSSWIANQGPDIYRAQAGDSVFQTVSLKEDARILVIDSWEDFQLVLSAYLLLDNLFAELVSGEWAMNSQFLDFEKMSADWDGVYLTQKGQRETHRGPDRSIPLFATPNLYGWDLESILVFNPDAIETISEAITLSPA